jgi:hypothetical protein
MEDKRTRHDHQRFVGFVGWPRHSLTSLGCRPTTCMHCSIYVNVYALYPVGHARGYGLQFADKRIAQFSLFLCSPSTCVVQSSID